MIDASPKGDVWRHSASSHLNKTPRFRINPMSPHGTRDLFRMSHQRAYSHGFAEDHLFYFRDLTLSLSRRHIETLVSAESENMPITNA